MKNIVGADLSRLNSTANQAHFHPNLEGKFQTAPIKDVFSLCEVLKTSLAPMLFFIFSSHHKTFCPPIFDTYYFGYRWCGMVLAVIFNPKTCLKLFVFVFLQVT